MRILPDSDSQGATQKELLPIKFPGKKEITILSDQLIRYKLLVCNDVSSLFDASFFFHFSSFPNSSLIKYCLDLNWKILPLSVMLLKERLSVFIFKQTIHATRHSFPKIMALMIVIFRLYSPSSMSLTVICLNFHWFSRFFFQQNNRSFSNLNRSELW